MFLWIGVTWSNYKWAARKNWGEDELGCQFRHAGNVPVDVCFPPLIHAKHRNSGCRAGAQCDGGRQRSRPMFTGVDSVPSAMVFDISLSLKLEVSICDSLLSLQSGLRTYEMRSFAV